MKHDFIQVQVNLTCQKYVSLLLCVITDTTHLHLQFLSIKNKILYYKDEDNTF
jgi:hypothetical protein